MENPCRLRHICNPLLYTGAGFSGLALCRHPQYKSLEAAGTIGGPLMPGAVIACPYMHQQSPTATLVRPKCMYRKIPQSLHALSADSVSSPRGGPPTFSRGLPSSEKDHWLSGNKQIGSGSVCRREASARDRCRLYAVRYNESLFRYFNLYSK